MRKEFGLKVKNRIEEALGAVSLNLEIPKDLQKEFSSKAGQFVGITADINGEEVHRSYSLSSSPFDKETLMISIKLVPGGKMSTYLVEKVKEGDTLKVTPPAGHFYKDSENKKNHVMFAAGSGVTPMMSVIKYLRKEKPKDAISLFYWNQKPATAMFLKELKELSESSPMVNVFYAYTQETVEGADFNKRVNPEILRSCFLKWSITIDVPVFYLCGPETFMGEIESFIGTKGFDPSQIRKENFYTYGSSDKSSDEASAGGDKSSDEETEVLVGDKSKKTDGLNSKCLALLDGDKVEASPEEGETILEAFLRSGESPPYSCMEGTCVACQCKVIEGLVEMPKDTFLSEEELEEGLILSCQAKMRSDYVKVDFDDF